MGLVMKGVPWEVVEQLEVHERFALLVAIGEIETGKVYDFERNIWPEDKH